MIYIRVDMNEIIATGHLVRCLSIADAIVEKGGNVTFILADNQAESIISERGFNTIVLNTNWSNMESELDYLQKLFKSDDNNYLLIDSYQVTEKYLSSVSQWTKTMYIDDLNSFIYPVDYLVCYAVYWKKMQHEKKYSQKQLLLGCEYTPMRQEFSDLPPKQISKEVKKVLVLSGGTDKTNIIKTILESLPTTIEEIDAICGTMNEHYEELVQCYLNSNNVKIHRSVSNIIDYMKKADIAISAGGTTLYELCACGTPTISYAMADNQLENVKCFDEMGLIEYIGDIRVDDITTKITSALDNYSGEKKRQCLSTKMQDLVDGRGAHRIAETLLKELK